MGYQESLELYLNLSRRELQLLCKKKNLPANRSHTQLAKSLALLSKKKNAGPTPSKVKSTSFASKPKEVGNISEDKSKDFVGAYERRTHILGSGINMVMHCLKDKEGADLHHSMAGDFMTASSHIDNQASDIAYTGAANAFSLDNLGQKQSDCSTFKTGNRTQGAAVTSDIVQIEKETHLGPEWHVGGTLNELKKYSELRNEQSIVQSNVASNSDTHNQVLNIMPRVAKSSTEGDFLSSKEVSNKDIPSFQFFVMAEEGINLHVDLNLSPSEWINSLKDEVSINLKMQDSKSSILHSHAQCYSEEADAQIKISPLENIGRYLHSSSINMHSECTTSTLSSDSENCQLMAPQPDATLVSSDSSILTSSSVPEKMPGCLNGNQVISSCATPLSEQKHMPFDTSSCPRDVNAFSEELINASSGREKSNALASDISVGPLSDMGLLSSDGNRHPEQMECCSPKINAHSNVVEATGFGNSLASIPEENNLLKSDETGKVLLMSDLDNHDIHNDASKVSIERQSVPETSDVAADHDSSSNFCKHGGHLILNCSATDADSDTTSVDHIHNRDACGLASIATDPDPVLSHGLGTQADEKETSECSLLQKSSENNSKRSHNFEFLGEFRNKKRRSSVEKKNGMMVNLRSTRTSAKGTICEQVIRPRRSTRLRSA